MVKPDAVLYREMCNLFVYAVGSLWEMTPIELFVFLGYAKVSTEP